MVWEVKDSSTIFLHLEFYHGTVRKSGRRNDGLCPKPLWPHQNFTLAVSNAINVKLRVFDGGLVFKIQSRTIGILKVMVRPVLNRAPNRTYSTLQINRRRV